MQMLHCNLASIIHTYAHACLDNHLLVISSAEPVSKTFAALNIETTLRNTTDTYLLTYLFNRLLYAIIDIINLLLKSYTKYNMKIKSVTDRQTDMKITQYKYT